MNLPGWVRTADTLLATAVRRARLLLTVTPTNLASELERLESSWRLAGPSLPRFSYAPLARDLALEAALAQGARVWAGEGALGALYAARARELLLELELCVRVGARDFVALASKRFGPRDAHDRRADTLARSWLGSAADQAAARPTDGRAGMPLVEAGVRSDDPDDPRSLLCRMQAEIGRLRLATRVRVVSPMSALAATGSGVVQVAGGKTLSVRDVERTVLHELHGHALPRARAAALELGLFGLGTAGGSDDQEGRALRLEERAGFLDAGRRRELALRHVAARAVEGGADFVATAELLAEFEPSFETRLRIAARVHRGGGLARERVYMAGWLRVEEALAAAPDLDFVLGAGQVSVEAAPILAPYVTRPERCG